MPQSAQLQPCSAKDYLRNADDAWMVGQLDANDVITLDCGKLRIPLSLDDLYEDVDLPA